MSNLRDKLKKITSGKASNWKAKSQLRRNTPWLREYSAKIARRVLSAIEDNPDLNQAKLAESLSVTPQQISKIVKGNENMTLETIYKLSKALNFELIAFPDYRYSYTHFPMSSIFGDLYGVESNTIDIRTLRGELKLHSVNIVEIKKEEIRADIFVQARILNIPVNQSMTING